MSLFLKLLLIDLRGEADAVEWARIMREDYVYYNGQPPPRRLMDDKVLRRVGNKISAPAPAR